MSNGINFGDLEAYSSSLLTPNRFEPREDFTERHGSWQIVYRRGSEDDDLMRFITVALTDEIEVPNSRWLVEVYFGAEVVGHSLRERLCAFLTEDGQFYRGPWQGTYREALSNAVDAVGRVRRIDLRPNLREAYPNGTHANFAVGD
jgi:hypothetical protein